MVTMLMLAIGVWVVVTTTMDRSAYPMIIADSVAVFAILAWPSYGFEILGVAISFGLTIMGLRWRPRRTETPHP